MDEKVINPYRQPFDAWKPEVLAAYTSFPKIEGLNAPINDRTWPQWREWAKTHPKELWPIPLHEFIAERKRQQNRRSGETGTPEKTAHIEE